MPLLESFVVGPGCFQETVNISLVNMTELRRFEVGDFAFARCSKLVLTQLEKLEKLVLLPYAFYHVRELIVQSRGEEGE